MCKIIVLEPGVMPTVEQLENATYNNWHSFGLVTKVITEGVGRLDIKRKVPASGEVDPKEVWDLLMKDIQYKRFLHLRHNTAGATNLENTHPFDLYYDEKTGRQVVWMHNGTMYQYVSKKKSATGTEVDDPDGPSDTKNFTDRVLIPLLTTMNHGNGYGDISNDFFQLTLDKFWNGSNRGLLISSDQKEVLIDKWVKKVGRDGKEYFASNDEYFTEVKRGPEYTRRRLREEEAKATAAPAGKSVITTRQVVKLSSFQKERHAFYNLSSSLCNISRDWDVYDRSGAVSLGYASRPELEELYNHKGDCLTVMDFVFTDYAMLYKEFQELEEKLKKAQKHIAAMADEIKNGKAERLEDAA